MRILLVDDDLLVRDTLAEVLRDADFEVTEATTGDEALPVFEQGAFEVLVTDVRMPGRTDGWDLAERCRAIKPDLPVIYVTGYSDVPTRQVSGSRVMRKPFMLHLLVDAVEGMVRRPAG